MKLNGARMVVEAIKAEGIKTILVIRAARRCPFTMRFMTAACATC